MKTGWRTASLGDVAEVIAGQSPDGAFYNRSGDGLPFYQGKKDFGDRSIRAAETWTTQVTKIAREGDVLMSVRAPVGPVNLATETCCIGRGLAAIRSGASLDRDYLFYFLRFREDEIRGREGAVFASISRREIEAMSVSFPSINEQQRIVRTLDEVTDSIGTARANAERSRLAAHALFASAFVSLAANSDQERWVRRTVSEIAQQRKGAIRTGPFGSQLLHSEFVDAGIAVLGIDNAVNNEFRWGKKRFITPAKYNELSRYRVKPGDVLITIMGTCGRCAVVPDDIPVAINTKHLCCITLDVAKCLPAFLHAYFLYHPVAREYLVKHAKGAIMAGLNMGIIRELPVVLPPLDQQESILRTFKQLRNETQRLESLYQRKLAVLDELKQSLLHEAFSGRLTERTLVEAGVP